MGASTVAPGQVLLIVTAGTATYLDYGIQGLHILLLLLGDDKDPMLRTLACVMALGCLLPSFLKCCYLS